MSNGNKPQGRLAFLDWLRGLAAILMINGHVFHSFTRPEDRRHPAYVLVDFIGGIPSAIFLFLVGVTLAFLMDSRARQGAPPAARVHAALRRGAYLLTLAFLFRLQLWLFAYPASPWTDLFKVDILNAMGLAVIVYSTLSLLTTRARALAGMLVGASVAMLSPLVSRLPWDRVPKLLAAYFVPDYHAFAFFPWAAFVGFGLSAGSLLRLYPREHYPRLLQYFALTGMLLVLGAHSASRLTWNIFPASEFWLDSPWLVFIKTGVILLMLAAAYLWTTYGASPGWSWVRQFGTTSLLVYWVHTELVYGRWLHFWKENLTVTQVAALSPLIILLMLGLSLLRTYWKHLMSLLASLRPAFYVPSRASGD